MFLVDIWWYVINIYSSYRMCNSKGLLVRGGCFSTKGKVGRFPSHWSHQSTHGPQTSWSHSGLTQTLKHHFFSQHSTIFHETLRQLTMRIYTFGLYNFSQCEFTRLRDGWSTAPTVLRHTATKIWCSGARANYHLKQTTQWTTKEHTRTPKQSHS